jgi:hypothetical protein
VCFKLTLVGSIGLKVRKPIISAPLTSLYPHFVGHLAHSCWGGGGGGALSGAAE